MIFFQLLYVGSIVTSISWKARPGLLCVAHITNLKVKIGRPITFLPGAELSNLQGVHPQKFKDNIPNKQLEFGKFHFPASKHGQPL